MLVQIDITILGKQFILEVCKGGSVYLKVGRRSLFWSRSEGLVTG